MVLRSVLILIPRPSKALGYPFRCVATEARASASVSIYSRTFVNLPFRTVNGEDPMVLKRLIRGFDSPRSEADDQNPVALRYELGGLWVRSFHRFVSLLK